MTNEAMTRRRTVTGVLMLPLFFLVALPGLFLGILHAPAPHDLKVAVIGGDTRSEVLAAQLSARAAGFRVERVTNSDTAVDAVRDREIRAAYDPATGDLYLASAGGAQATEAARSLFAAAARSTGTPMRVHDVVPLPDADRVGTSALYLGVGAIVGGFLSGLIILMAAPGLRLAAQLGALFAMSVAIAGIETCYGWVIFDIFPGNAAAAAAVLGGLASVSGLVTAAGMRLIGPAMVMVSILVLVLAGVTASGLPVQLELVPDIYRWMHEALPTARGLSALRSVGYFGGENIAGDVITMVIWGVASLIVLVATRGRPDAEGATVLENIDVDEAAAVASASAASV